MEGWMDRQKNKGHFNQERDLRQECLLPSPPFFLIWGKVTAIVYVQRSEDKPCVLVLSFYQTQTTDLTISTFIH